MKTLKVLSLAGLFLILITNRSNAKRPFDADNPPNPGDVSMLSLNFINKTDMSIKVSFFLDNKKIYHGKIIDAGKSLIFEVEGRYNKKKAYFRFRRSDNQYKGTGIKFFYKQVAKAKGIKIDEIYLLQDNSGNQNNAENFIISTTEEINPLTTLLKGDISAALALEPYDKHKNDKRHKKSKKHKSDQN